MGTSIDHEFSKVVDQMVSHFRASPLPVDHEFGDRRKSQRAEYSTTQLVAPSIDGRLPNRHEFQEVRCCDLSSGGFSYLSDHAVRATSVVAAFGLEPDRLHLMAEVVHCTPTEVDGKRRYLVGCVFTGRICS